MASQVHPARHNVVAKRDNAPGDPALIVVGFALLFLAIPHGIFGDAVVRFEALQELIEQGTLSHTAYSFVEPLFAVPFYLLGKLCFGPAWWCAHFNTMLLAAGVVVARLLSAVVPRRDDPRLFQMVGVVRRLCVGSTPAALRGGPCLAGARGAASRLVSRWAPAQCCCCRSRCRCGSRSMAPSLRSRTSTCVHRTSTRWSLRAGWRVSREAGGGRDTASLEVELRAGFEPSPL